ncbi:SNF2-like, N-terminal domain superfamily [Sesbania bispinosa]|nr:SNF2-like, N-terminal domain superfamily [Sesbania bispinosa]
MLWREVDDAMTEKYLMEETKVQPRRGRRYQEEEQCNGDSKPELEPKDKDKEDNDSHEFTINTSHYRSIENGSVWSLIPELSEKMHDHQKKGFQFIWQNIAGSIQPALMEVESERRGGCVISHTPGAGKTFLVIAFLEFIKWEIPILVYLIHGHKDMRDFDETPLDTPGVPNPTSDVKHVFGLP